MANNLVQLIFDQFVAIVIKIASKCRCEVDVCDFDFRVRELTGYRIIDVLYVAHEQCGRTRDVVTTIDFTNICFEDLTSCEWIQYLKKIAREYVADICPRRVVIVKDKKRRCREEPPVWEPFPCQQITHVVEVTPVEPIIPRPKIIYEHECECVPQCERKPCIAQERIIIRRETEHVPWRCGDYTVSAHNKHHSPQSPKRNGFHGHQNHTVKQSGCGCK